MDFCEFFKAIERDPKAIVKLTIGEYFGAAQHVKECQSCADIVDKVDSMNPDKDNTIGFNPN